MLIDIFASLPCGQGFRPPNRDWTSAASTLPYPSQKSLYAGLLANMILANFRSPRESSCPQHPGRGRAISWSASYSDKYVFFIPSDLLIHITQFTEVDFELCRSGLWCGCVIGNACVGSLARRISSVRVQSNLSLKALKLSSTLYIMRGSKARIAVV